MNGASIYLQIILASLSLLGVPALWVTQASVLRSVAYLALARSDSTIWYGSALHTKFGLTSVRIVLGMSHVREIIRSKLPTWHRGYKTFFVLNSAEHEILTAHKY